MTEEPETSIPTETQNKYRIWKKNAPFLYDYLSTHTLLWPSLTVQFFPDLEQDGQIHSQRLLHGSFTLGQHIDSISIVQMSHIGDINSHIGMHNLDYNPEKEEFNWTGQTPPGDLKVLQKINQRGDVNAVKYMPQNPNVLCSANSFGEANIYERSKHPSFRKKIDQDSINNPELRLQLETKSTEDVSPEIFALDWNASKEGALLVANMDGDINVFDIKDAYQANTTSQKNSALYKNNSGVNEIQWIPGHRDLFALCDESGHARMYDTRTRAETRKVNASNAGVNSLCVNRLDPMRLVTGDSTGAVKIWDWRNGESYDSFQHDGSITRVKWNPQIPHVFGASSVDAKVKLYDAKGEFFSHNGHMLGVNDFDWSLHDAWMVASMGDDNSLHVWKPAKNMVNRG